MRSIAFIVLNYNDSDTTIHMVNNLCTWQCCQFYLHVVIVDNYSTDKSFEKLQQYYKSEEKIVVISSNYNGGYSYGNNYGARFAIEHYAPDFIAIANPDIIVDENTVIELLATFNEEKSLLMCAPVMKDIKGKYCIQTQKLPSYKDDLVACFTENNNKTVRYDKFDYLNGKTNMILTEMLPGSFYVVRTDLFQKIGMLDEGVFLFCEERILGYKMKQQRYKAVLRSDLFFLHKHGTSINKAYKAISTRKILLQSRCYYQNVYNECGRVNDIILRSACVVSILYLRVKLYAYLLLKKAKERGHKRII